MLWGNVQTESVWSVMGSARARVAVRVGGGAEAAATPGTSPARAPDQARSCFQGRDLQVNGSQALSEGRGRATWATFGQRGASEAQVPAPWQGKGTFLRSPQWKQSDFQPSWVHRAVPLGSIFKSIS